MKIEDSSFRDRDGYIFERDNEIYRAINPAYFADFDKFVNSGLYQSLVDQKLLVAHELCNEADFHLQAKVIKPERIPFISYPYEWSFHQLKRAALLTLDLQLEAMKFDMSLKDATAFNVQFLHGKPIFIDTLSFESYTPGQPWQAYKQFCQHFLLPLALQKYGVSELNKLQQIHIDGIPLSLGAQILPFKSNFNILFYTHLHLNAKYENKYKNKREISGKQMSLPKEKLRNILLHLRSSVQNLSLPKSKTNWTDYYAEYTYDEVNIREKKEFVIESLKHSKPKTVVDSGSNTGLFSEVSSPYAEQVISFDFDASVIHNQCKSLVKNKITNILPLIVDVTNPTPAIGWNNTERKSFMTRLDKDATTLSLALIHHLVLSNNLTHDKIASYYAQFSKHLIIEFVPKDDEQSKRLLVTKKDIFDDYTEEHFLSTFELYFKLIRKHAFSNSKRTIYFFERI